MALLMLAVFIGGGTGSLLRWWLGLRLNSPQLALAPGTLAANLLGAFIIGAALALFARLPQLNPGWRTLIMTGFCGGLTTFSTFSAEIISLLQNGRMSLAALHLLLNLAGSLLMTALAFWLVSLLSSR